MIGVGSRDKFRHVIVTSRNKPQHNHDRQSQAESGHWLSSAAMSAMAPPVMTSSPCVCVVCIVAISA